MTVKRDWFQIITNLGVVLGLVVVAYQVYLDRKLVEAQVYIDSYSIETDRWLAEMGEAPAASLARAAIHPESLTPEDFFVLEARVKWVISMMRRNAIREEYGLRDSSWRTTLLRRVGSDIGSVEITKKILLRQQTDAEADWMADLKRYAEAKVGTEYAERIRQDLNYNAANADDDA